MEKAKLGAKAVLQDLRSGMDDSDMMKKYNLSETGLHRLYDKLVDKGLAQESELRRRGSPSKKLATKTAKCPACGKQHASQLSSCPECGFDRRAKVTEKPSRAAPQSDAPFQEYSQRGFEVAEKAISTGKKYVVAGTTRAKQIAGDISQMELVKDLSEMNLVEEIVPIDDSNIIALRRDFIFWFVAFLGVVPLIIATLESTNTQITMFALFFAFVWAIIFKRMVMGDQATWKLPVASFLFTGTVGMVLLLALYQVMPSFYLGAVGQ